MKRREFLQKSVIMGLAVLWIGLTGCGPATPPLADKVQAIKSLTSALDAWKKGEKPEAVKQSLSIQMFDPAWDKGLKLKRFQIDESQSNHSGFDLVVPVKMWFETSEDEEPRIIKFSISTTPSLIITRNYEGF